MEIIIHRGTHQIGGCVTEIKTEEVRIIIDMGTPLPGSKTENETGAAEEEVIALPGVTVPVAMDGEADKNENAQMIKSQPCDAVFITHYHGDHIGRIDSLLPEIPLYIGKAAKEIYSIYSGQTKQDEKVKRLQNAHAYTPGQPIQIKDFTVTPLLTSHSALDAYMLLIEAGGKTILHTGDFSLHGYEGKKWLEGITKCLANKNITLSERYRAGCVYVFTYLRTITCASQGITASSQMTSPMLSAVMLPLRGFFTESM